MRKNSLPPGVFLLISLLAPFCSPALVYSQTGVSSHPVSSFPATQTPVAAKVSIAGKVINSVTGEGIRRALVELQGAVRSAVLTDDQGNFRIEDLPANTYVSLSARKPGFLNQQELGQGNALWQPLSAIATPVTLPLTPQAVITGTVARRETGLPIQGLPVIAVCSRMEQGRRLWDQRRQTSTDEDGHYRIAGLKPGPCYLRAGPRAGRLAPFVRAEEKQRFVGYPATYYPASPDMRGATLLQLAGGQQLNADFSLPRVAAYRIAGALAAPDGAHGVWLQVTDPSGENIGIGPMYTAAQSDSNYKTFFMLMPAGAYRLLANASDQTSANAFHADAPLSVAADANGVMIPLRPVSTIPVHVQLIGSKTSDLSSMGYLPLRMQFYPTDGRSAALFGTLVEVSGPSNPPTPPRMQIRNLMPGKYWVAAEGSAPWYVQSATYGPSDLTREELVVTPSAQDAIEVTLRDDSAMLTGTVLSGGKPAGAATLLVIPDSAPRTALVFHTQPDGTFAAAGIGPGDYSLLAVERSGDLEYANPAALEPYRSQMTHITLSANQQATIKLELAEPQP